MTHSPDNPDRRRPDRPPGRTGRWLWFVAAGGLLILLLAWLFERFPNALSSEGEKMRFFYLLALLFGVSAGVAGGWRYRSRAVFKHVAAWIAIALVLLVGYSFRFEIEGLANRVAGELLPHRATVADAGAVTMRRGLNRHFNVDALVDGVSVRFLVDTGASVVVLSPNDARRLGFDPARLSFNRVYSTANGTVMGAPVRLDEVRIGPIAVRDVRASVNGGALDQSLLGLSFLDRIGAYEVRDDTLTLRP